MAIVKVGGGGGLERRVGLKAAKKAAKKGAKKGAKHAVEKHAAKKHAIEKHAAKKHAEKHAGKKAAKKSASAAGLSNEALLGSSPEASDADAALLSRAFHHLHRSSALISLLEPESGGDLRQLLEHGIELYRAASESAGERDMVRCAVGLLRASEHLAMAGLYSARSEFRVRVTPPEAGEVQRHLQALGPRMEKLGQPEKAQAQRLLAMARELLRRAQSGAESDPHLDYELTMAADGLCAALEEGL